jgi:hypothetical protein
MRSATRLRIADKWPCSAALSRRLRASAELASDLEEDRITHANRHRASARFLATPTPKISEAFAYWRAFT